MPWNRPSSLRPVDGRRRVRRRPSAAPSCEALEGRAVLSHVFHLTSTSIADVDRPPADVAQTLDPSAMVPGAPAAPAGGNTFPLDIADTLKAGLPVYEQRQTTTSDTNAYKTVDELIVPDPGGGRTTTQWVLSGQADQPGSQVVSKVVDVKTLDGGTTTDVITTTQAGALVSTEVDTAVTNGNTTTHDDVTTQADGTVQATTETDIKQGNRTLIEDGSQPAPDGATETYSGFKETVGDRTIAYKTFNQPGGPVKTSETITTSLGDSGQDMTVITTHPHGAKIISNNSTVVARLIPPTS